MFYPDRDFIRSLSEGEKFIFLKIICGLVAADRQVSKGELGYLRELAQKYEVSGEKLSVMIKTADKESLLKQARLITNRPKALALIKDLCMVANVDVDLTDDEIDFVLDVAEAMNIEAKKVQEINTIVNEYLALSQRAYVLLEQEYWT